MRGVKNLLLTIAFLTILTVFWLTENHIEKAEHYVSLQETITSPTPTTTTTATWYAHPTDRWFKRIPALGLKDKTRRTIKDYAQNNYCLAVPIKDTARFPLGSTVIVQGQKGVENALIVDVNEGTTWDLEARLFERICGNLRTGKAQIEIYQPRPDK